MQSNFTRRTPVGDERDRLVCDGCGFINYENPKIVVGAVCTWEDHVLMCRRDIEPRRGHWTIPAGFLELGETTEEGAAREVREEALADVQVDSLLAVYSIARISQVLMIYRARMRSPAHAAGEESADSALYTRDQIPWNDLAFPSVRWALEAHFDTGADFDGPPRGVPADAKLGPLPAAGEAL